MKNPSQAPKPAWQYFKATLDSSAFLMQLSALSDFVRLAEMQSAKAVFLLGEDASGIPAHFAIPYNGGLLQQAAQGFRTLEEYAAARSAGFTEATEYHSAITAGYQRYDDYKLAVDTGITEADTVTEMKKRGFVEGFAQWQEIKEEMPDIGAVSNPYELYQEAKARHFEDWETLRDALQKGFSQAHDYQVAKGKGFPDAKTYEGALARGLTSMEEYNFAEEHHLRDARDIRVFSELAVALGGPEMPFDQKVLLILLSRLEQGKRASANKLWEHLGRMKDEHRYEDTSEMPRWFTQAMQSREEMISFLSGNDIAKGYGSYDGDGEFFEIKRLRDREVVLDGSNVAYNSANRKDQKPRVANILLMVRFLKTKGFERVSVISDASLRHRIEDPEKLPELEEAAEYIEAPAEKPADVFIIQHVRNTHCLLVSNDTFREWKTQEPWVAENIDYYRLTFLIRGEEVIMPDVA